LKKNHKELVFKATHLALLSTYEAFHVSRGRASKPVSAKEKKHSEFTERVCFLCGDSSSPYISISIVAQ